MNFEVLSLLKNRVRIRLKIPAGFSIDGFLSEFDGEFRFIHNRRTQTLLIENFRREVLDEFLNRLKNLSLREAKRDFYGKRVKSDDKHNLKGLLIKRLAMPLLLPRPLRMVLFGKAALSVLRKGLRSVLRGNLDVNVLDASTVLGALLARDFKSAKTIVFLLSLGEKLEEWTRERSRRILWESLMWEDGFEWVLREGVQTRVKTSELREGDLVIFRAGGRISVDGVVEEGEAMVNQSSITGEPLSVEKRKGSSVYAGTVVEEGMLIVRALRVGPNTVTSKIVRLIEQNIEKRSERENYAERLANRLVPLTFSLGAFIFLLTGNLRKALSVLVVDYSCAIRLFTPLAFLAGMINAAKNGVVVKGSKYLELLSDAKIFVLDKTGTLTEANPKVEHIISLGNMSEREILKIAACVEEHFPHPVANAITEKAKKEGVIHDEEHTEVKYIAAHGIITTLNGKVVMIGSRHFIVDDAGISDFIHRGLINELSSRGYSILYLAVDGKLSGIILLNDPIRKEAESFLRELKRRGIRTVMLTGDSIMAAERVSKSLGIDEYYAEVLPEQKMEIIEKLRDSSTVVMVGDGMNDSPALTKADIGISLRQGADLAKEVSDVIVMSGSLLSINHLLALSEEILRVIRHNYMFTIVTNSFLILNGLLGVGSPATHALIHNLVTLVTALNSMRIINFSKREGGKDDSKKYA